MNKPFSIFALAISGWLLASPVQAQMSPDLIMETYNSNIRVITNGIINKNMMDKAVARNKGKATGSGRNISVNHANFAYTPTAALKKKTVDRYVAQIRATNPAVATTLATNLAPGKIDYSAIYHESIQGSGLTENNAADVLAAYLILNWMVINNVQDGKAITVPMARGVRAQTLGILSKNAKSISPEVAAQMGEQMKLNTALLQIGWVRSVKDKTDATFRDKIAAQFKTQYHMDMRQIQLTDAGFTKK